MIETTIGHQSLVYAGTARPGAAGRGGDEPSPALVPLFLAPVIAVYFTAAMSVRREHQACTTG